MLRLCLVGKTEDEAKKVEAGPKILKIMFINVCPALYYIL